MGFSTSWLAFKDRPRDFVLTALGLRGTERFEEILKARLTGLQLPTGWYLVIANGGDYPAFMGDKVLARLSAESEIATCDILEFTMTSRASYWRDGQELWSIWHTADTEGIEHLDTKGELPPYFESICKNLGSKQEAAGGNNAQVDYIFDVAIETAERLTGFRHDTDIPDLGREPFEILETTAATPTRSWWRKILGF